MNKVYIGIGTNIGDRLDNIKKTIAELEKKTDISNIRVSSIYETLPYGNIKQENFYNAAIYFETSLSLDDLLEFSKAVEKKIGRVKRENWGPREIDLDILLYNNMVFENENIVIPHKDLLNRDFVLVPLLELNKKLIHPVSKKKLSYYLSGLTGKYIISKFRFDISEVSESIH